MIEIEPAKGAHVTVSSDELDFGGRFACCVRV
jgi:hypothetical protein